MLHTKKSYTYKYVKFAPEIVKLAKGNDYIYFYQLIIIN